MLSKIRVLCFFYSVLGGPSGPLCMQPCHLHVPISLILICHASSNTIEPMAGSKYQSPQAKFIFPSFPGS